VVQEFSKSYWKEVLFYKTLKFAEDAVSIQLLVMLSCESAGGEISAAKA
jgi:hypothetical protein